jgi:hypothetical protein
MPSTFQPNGAPSNLIGEGFSALPTSGSADSSMLNQQQNYFLQCTNFVNAAGIVRNGRDLTSAYQVYLLQIQNSTFLTLAQANTYFPGCTSIYWSQNGIVDFKQALANMQAAIF